MRPAMKTQEKPFINTKIIIIIYNVIKCKWPRLLLPNDHRRPRVAPGIKQTARMNRVFVPTSTSWTNWRQKKWWISCSQILSNSTSTERHRTIHGRTASLLSSSLRMSSHQLLIGICTITSAPSRIIPFTHSLYTTSPTATSRSTSGFSPPTTRLTSTITRKCPAAMHTSSKNCSRLHLPTRCNTSSTPQAGMSPLTLAVVCLRPKSRGSQLSILGMDVSARRSSRQ